MSGEDPAGRDLVERYLQRHPDASIPEVTGALANDVDPETVREVVDETSPEPEESPRTVGEINTSGSRPRETDTTDGDSAGTPVGDDTTDGQGSGSFDTRGNRSEASDPAGEDPDPPGENP